MIEKTCPRWPVERQPGASWRKIWQAARRMGELCPARPPDDRGQGRGKKQSELRTDFPGKQRLSEFRKLAVALLWAEAKLGELLAGIDKSKGYDGLTSSGGRKPILPPGITHKQSFFSQKLAGNKEEKAHE